MESAPIDQLTSTGLREVRDLVAAAHKEFVRLSAALGPAEKRKADAIKRAHAWEHDELRQTLFAGKYEKVLDEYEDARDDLKEIKAHLEACRITLGMDVGMWAETSYGALVSAFRGLARCVRSWDITRTMAVNTFAERTAANLVLTRVPIVLDERPSEALAHAGATLRVQNANSGDMFLYPALLMVAKPGGDFALLDLVDVQVKYESTIFQETDTLPADADVMGEKWKRVNADGSSDRRFSDNYSIPIVPYGTLRFLSGSGLKEEYMFSNFLKARDFAWAFEAHQKALVSAGAG